MYSFKFHTPLRLHLFVFNYFYQSNWQIRVLCILAIELSYYISIKVARLFKFHSLLSLPSLGSDSDAVLILCFPSGRWQEVPLTSHKLTWQTLLFKTPQMCNNNWFIVNIIPSKGTLHQIDILLYIILDISVPNISF